MKRKEGQNIRLNELPEDPSHELRRCGAGNALFHKELKAYKQLFEEDEAMDDSYKILLVCLLVNEERFEPQTKQKGIEIVSEPLLYLPMKGKRSKPCMKLKEKDHLIEHDGVRKNAGKALEKRPVPREKLKNKNHLIEHDDVRENASKALGERLEPLKKLKDKDHLIEHEGVRINAGKALEERFELHKRKDKGCLIERDDVRENAGKALEKRFEPHKKRRGKGHLIVHEDVRKNAGKALEERLEQNKKRKDKEHLIEHDDVRENVGKAFKERFEHHKKQKGKKHLIEHDDVRENAGKALKERLEPHKKRKYEDRSIEDEGVRENSGEENDLEYELFLKHLKDLGKSYAVEYKKDSINVVIKYDKGIGSDKDCEPEPRRKSSRIIKQNLGLPNQVPNVEKPQENDQKDNLVKSSRTDKKLNNEDEKVEIKTLSSNELRNFIKKSKNKDEKADIEKCPARDFRNVIRKRSRDEDEKAEIEKCRAHDFRNVIRKRSRDEDEKAEIEKYPARDFRSTVMKKLRDEDENLELEKCPACEFMSTIMKTPRDEAEKAEIEKYPAREFRSTVMKKSRDEHKKVEIEKRSACELRNVVMQKLRNEDEKDIEKIPARDFRNVKGANKSSMPHKSINDNNGEEESEDSDVEIIDMNAECLKGPFVSSKRFGKSWEKNGSRSSNPSDEFRRQVLEVLTKPFDKDEYIVLKTEFEARCYTDYHPDLGRKLKKWRYNQRKRLAILRGFFFWLQNLTREGAFKPWTDGVCLTVEPQSPETNPGNTSGS